MRLWVFLPNATGLESLQHHRGADHMRKFTALEVAEAAVPDKQISLTDPARDPSAMNFKGTGVFDYNVQATVDAAHHLIVAHGVVTNIGDDRGQAFGRGQRGAGGYGASDLISIA